MTPRSVPPWATVAGLVALSAALRFWSASHFSVPWIAPDESIYALLGRSLWSSGSLDLLGQPTSFYSLVYPAVVGLPLSLADVGAGITVVQALQALLMSGTAAIVYAWGRGPLGSAWALMAALLTVAIPGLAYSGLVMTEAVFYPIVTLALWAVATMLTRPTLRLQALVALAVGVAVLTRVQAVGLVPALYLAAALYCFFARSLAPARRLIPLLAGVAGACVLALVVGAVSGRWSSGFGSYSPALGGYDLGAAARAVVWHSGDVFVVVAGIPLVALAAMVVCCIRRLETDDRTLALVATTTAWTVCAVVEVGVFASKWVSTHLAERDLITVAPPLFLVFALWLARAVPRPRPWTQLAALAVAAPAVLLPVGRFASPESALDAFSFIPLERLAATTSEGTLTTLFPLAAAGLAVAAVLVPARQRLVLPLLTGVVLISLSAISSVQIARLSRLDRVWVFGSTDRDWIDAATTRPVVYLQAATTYPASFWKEIFWNQRIESVARIPDAAPVPPIEATIVAPRFDGLLLGKQGDRVQERLIAAPTELELAGRRIAQTPSPSTDLNGFALWQVDPPTRIRMWTSGFQPNGDIVGDARITVYGCERGRLSLTLLGKQGTPVVLAVDGLRYAKIQPRSGAVWQGDIPAPSAADGGVCVFEVHSSGLLGSTIITFEPD